MIKLKRRKLLMGYMTKEDFDNGNVFGIVDTVSSLRDDLEIIQVEIRPSRRKDEPA